MIPRPMLSQILDNESVTRGLADPEARLLVEWLVERAEDLEQTATSAHQVEGWVKKLCVRARAIARFVMLWCHRRERGAAIQLAASERFSWPLPQTGMDPCDLMSTILEWEAAHSAIRA